MPRLSLLALALTLLSCATPLRRPLVGRVHLRAIEPEVVTQRRTDLAITVEEGGILAGSGLYLAHHQGCLRGSIQQRDIFLCPWPAVKGEPARWHSNDRSVRLNFDVVVDAQAQNLHVTLGREEAHVRLGPGEAIAELRFYPEFVGALFALGLVPEAKDARYELVPD